MNLETLTSRILREMSETNKYNGTATFRPRQVFTQAYQGISPAAQVPFFDPTPLQQDPRLRNKSAGIPLFNLSGLFV